MDLAVGFAAVVALIAANAVFVAGEFSLVAVDRLRIEELAASRRSARLTLQALERLSFQLSGAQLGITVSSLVLGFVAEPTIGRVLEPVLDPVVPERALGGVGVVVALVVASGAQMVVGELVPKNLAIARPERTALFAGPLMHAFVVAASPVIWLFDSLSTVIVRRFGVEPRDELSGARTVDELEMMVAASGEHGSIEPGQLELLTRALRFADKTAAEALTPRVDVRAIPAGATVADLVALAAETGLSRFPVAGDDLDDLRGVAHVKDAFGVPSGSRPGTPISAVTSDALVVPETRDLDELLSEMRAGGRQMAVVVDEYGGTAGIITIEDVLEELVGHIRDEFDPSSAARLTVPLQLGNYVMEGSLHLDEVSDLVSLEIPDGGYETLAGFLLVLFGRIPDQGDSVEWQGWRFEVLELDRRRIALVLVRPPKGWQRR